MDQRRRRICQTGGGLILAGALLPAAAGCGGTATSGGNSDAGTDRILAGTVDQLPVGMVLFVTTPEHNVNVCRDAKGLYAVDGNCTHAHCVLLFGDMANPSGFACPCHMSTFDYNGQNPTGPATTTGPLPHYEVTIAGTQIFVDATKVVDAAARTPL